jgi:hypothetical protein
MWDASTLTVFPEATFDKVVFASEVRPIHDDDFESDREIHTVNPAKIPSGPRRATLDASTLTVLSEATPDTVFSRPSPNEASSTGLTPTGIAFPDRASETAFCEEGIS